MKSKVANLTKIVLKNLTKKNLFSQLRQKILEAHANVKDLNLLEAKMNFKR